MSVKICLYMDLCLLVDHLARVRDTTLFGIDV